MSCLPLAMALQVASRSLMIWFPRLSKWRQAFSSNPQYRSLAKQQQQTLEEELQLSCVPLAMALRMREDLPRSDGPGVGCWKHMKLECAMPLLSI